MPQEHYIAHAGRMYVPGCLNRDSTPHRGGTQFDLRARSLHAIPDGVAVHLVVELAVRARVAFHVLRHPRAVAPSVGVGHVPAGLDKDLIDHGRSWWIKIHIGWAYACVWAGAPLKRQQVPRAAFAQVRAWVCIRATTDVWWTYGAMLSVWVGMYICVNACLHAEGGERYLGARNGVCNGSVCVQLTVS